MELRRKLTDPRYLFYLVTLILSLILLFIGQTFMPGNTENSLIFAFAHFIPAVGALVGLIWVKKDERKDYSVIVWLLFFVSCYALNRYANVFNATTPWFAVYLVITSASLLMFRYTDHLPQWARTITGMLAGLALIAYIYLSLFLFPLYPMSVIALIALGLSIHTFVPLILCLVVGWNLSRRRLWKSGLSGMGLGLAAIIIFSMLYNLQLSKLTHIYNRQQVRGNGRLPAWIEAARQLKGGFVMERVLKTGIVYREATGSLSDILGEFSFRGIGNFNWENETEHDPLVVIASMFFPGRPALPAERIKILEAMYDKRHQGEERLWSGNSLHTSYVSTQVKIWPELHLAYTEKALTVTNSERWGMQEAIYTFQLPEGGVVTSLSLWIDGKEEKGILTAKGLADTAYRTIVGRERRDPSLVRWQEGNRVSVRVFPVNGGETRMFRIGVTAPLSVENGRLQYDNITFQGPPLRFTTEDASIELAGKSEGFTPPAGFRRSGAGWEREGRYRKDWHLQMNNTPIRPNTFSFNGNSYSIRPYKLQRKPVRTDVIYLDVNAAWSRSEFDETLKLTGKRRVMVSLNDQLTDVRDDNKDDLFYALHCQRFSLFPVQDIIDPEHALVVTKNLPFSPSLRDLEDSRFRKELDTWLADSSLPKIRLMNLGAAGLPPYLKTLKESRVFRYEQGGLLQLAVLLSTNTFAEDAETADRVVIDQAQAVVERTLADSTAAQNAVRAPDHLMRIFAYNHIVSRKGKGLITSSGTEEALVNVAKEAYVVSPVSSLIVLETQNDYDRFGIKDEGNSLKNASLKSKGAVPEPHEWALIVIVLLSLTWFIYQRKWKPANA